MLNQTTPAKPQLVSLPDHVPVDSSFRRARRSERQGSTRRIRGFAAVGALLALGLAAQAATMTYTVVSGDTLSEIAEDAGVSTSELLALNDLRDPDRLLVGQQLQVPVTRHLVARGETLSEIADQYDVSLAELSELNGIADPNDIWSGMFLDLPNGSAVSTPAGSYVVAEGDTLGQIAATTGVSVEAIVEANGLTDADLISVGLVLILPGATATAPPVSEPSAAAEPAPEEATTEAVAAPVPADAPPGLPQSILSNPERLALVPTFRQEAQANDVPADLLMALTYIESGWQRDAVSSVGALGIGQLLPGTVEFTNQELLDENLDPLVATENIRLAARYLRYLMDRTATEDDAVAAYFQGLASIESQGRFGETVAYVDGIARTRSMFR